MCRAIGVDENSMYSVCASNSANKGRERRDPKPLRSNLKRMDVRGVGWVGERDGALEAVGSISDNGAGAYICTLIGSSNCLYWRYGGPEQPTAEHFHQHTESFLDSATEDFVRFKSFNVLYPCDVAESEEDPRE